MHAYREQVIVDNNKMNLYVARPESDRPVPAVVVIQHQNGVDRFTEEMTERTAAAGYFAVSPDLYHRDGPDCKDDGPTRRGRVRDVNVINDVNAAVGYLKNQKAVDAGRTAIIGFCMGGRVAYLMAAASKDFKTAIAWYGGSCFRAWGDGLTPFQRTAEIDCPIQGHFGETDPNPSMEDMAKLDAELTKYGKLMTFTLTRTPALRSWIGITPISMLRSPIAYRGSGEWSFCGSIWRCDVPVVCVSSPGRVCNPPAT